MCAQTLDVPRCTGTHGRSVYMSQQSKLKHATPKALSTTCKPLIRQRQRQRQRQTTHIHAGRMEREPERAPHMKLIRSVASEVYWHTGVRVAGQWQAGRRDWRMCPSVFFLLSVFSSLYLPLYLYIYRSLFLSLSSLFLPLCFPPFLILSLSLILLPLSLSLPLSPPPLPSCLCGGEHMACVSHLAGH